MMSFSKAAFSCICWCCDRTYYFPFISMRDTAGLLMTDELQCYVAVACVLDNRGSIWNSGREIKGEQ